MGSSAKSVSFCWEWGTMLHIASPFNGNPAHDRRYVFDPKLKVPFLSSVIFCILFSLR
jgi:hypothetical protein